VLAMTASSSRTFLNTLFLLLSCRRRRLTQPKIAMTKIIRCANPHSQRHRALLRRLVILTRLNGVNRHANDEKILNKIG